MDSDKKIVINMLSGADKVEGQGVGGTYLEQANLVKKGVSDLFTVEVDSGKKADIIRPYTVDPQNYLRMKNNRNVNVCYVHFLPDTLNRSIQLPKTLFSVFKKYMISFYKTAGYLIVINPIFVKGLEKYGITREKMIHIPNYMPKGQFHVKPVERRNAIRERYGIEADDFVIIGVGQVRTRKGVLDFVDAAKKLPDVRFAWCGGFSFGKITDGHEELKKVVENPPVSVQFLGIIPRSDMDNIYNMADVLFMPSYNGLFPMVILEAVDLHRPMVLHSLGLYEGILLKKYQMADDSDGFVELTQRLHEDPACCVRCAADGVYISEHHSKENVLSI